MILNNVHDLSSIFLCINESRLELFFQLIVHILFIFCVIHSTRFQQHTIVYMQWIYISDTNNRRSQCWNGMSSIHLFICSIYFDRNEIILMNGCFFVIYPLYNTAIHLLSTNYCWPIHIDIYLWNVNSHFFFFFYLVLVLFINENNFIDRITFFIMFFVFVLLYIIKFVDSIFRDSSHLVQFDDWEHGSVQQ